MKPAFVIKIGGSLLYDKDLMLNRAFLFKFLKWYERAKDEYKQIVIVVGGGKISRHITSQLSEVVPEVNSLHRIGMATTFLNSVILKSFLHDDDIYIPTGLGGVLKKIIGGERGVVISGGFKEGWSTDMDAAVFANVLGVKTLHKLSNIDYVYTADPKTDPDATPIRDITWEKYMLQFGITPGVTEHKPNGHLPVGEMCTQFAVNKGMTVKLSGGKRLDENLSLEEVLDGGSIIHP